MEFNIMNEKLKTMREVALLDEIKSNSLQIEQLSEDIRGLMYAIRDLTEQLAIKETA
jgi:hypothetical protein